MTPSDVVLTCLNLQPIAEIVQVEVVEDKPKATKLVLRIHPSDQAEDAWYDLMPRIMEALHDYHKQATYFIGKSYQLRKGELTFAWIVCLYGVDSHDNYLDPLRNYFGVDKVARPRGRQIGVAGSPGRKVKEVRTTREIGRRVPSLPLQGAGAGGPNVGGKGAWAVPASPTSRGGFRPPTGGRGSVG